MGNPVVHAIAFIAAVLIPGGLLVYFAWRTARSISPKGEPNQTSQKEGLQDIPDELPGPDEVLEAYLAAFPKYSKESLRARSRANRIHVAKTAPRKKSQ